MAFPSKIVISISHLSNRTAHSSAHARAVEQLTPGENRALPSNTPIGWRFHTFISTQEVHKLLSKSAKMCSFQALFTETISSIYLRREALGKSLQI